MTTTEDGGPAYPNTHHDQHEWTGRGGLSLRDWFAGQALAGLCANMGQDRFVEMSTAHMADLAMRYADAMIAVRASIPLPEGE